MRLENIARIAICVGLGLSATTPMPALADTNNETIVEVVEETPTAQVDPEKPTIDETETQSMEPTIDETEARSMEPLETVDLKTQSSSEKPTKREKDTLEYDDSDEAVQNAKRIWSIFASYGLNDKQIAGIIAYNDMECGVDPTGLEGPDYTPYQMDDDERKIATSHTEMSKWTKKLFDIYESQGLAINQDAYEYDGRYYCGIGLFSDTGEPAYRLMIAAENANRDWWDLDFQTAAQFSNPNNTTATGQNIFAAYKTATKGMSPENATEWLSHRMGYASKEYMQELKVKAKEWYNAKRIRKWNIDRDYGQRVLDLASTLDFACHKKVPAMSLNPSLAKGIQVGKTTKLLQDAAEAHGKATFRSSDPSILSVTKKGKVRAKKAGKATITVTYAANDMFEARTERFDVTVKRIKLKKSMISNVKARYRLRKKSVRPKPVVTHAGKRLKRGTDYKVSYKDDRQLGTATLVIKGKGNYRGTIKLTYQII